MANMTYNTQKTGQLTVQGKSNIRNNPPKATRWQKGCASPNPKGRPRTAEVSEAARAILEQEDPKLRKTGLQRLFELWLRRALQGDTKKGELLLAYGYGRPAQSIETSGADGAPFEVKITHIAGANLDCTSNAPKLGQ
jgi:hypothetical protein